MTLIVVIMGLIVGLVLAVIFLARLLTHHTVMWMPEWAKPAPRATSRNTLSRNDHTSPRASRG